MKRIIGRGQRVACCLLAKALLPRRRHHYAYRRQACSEDCKANAVQLDGDAQLALSCLECLPVYWSTTSLQCNSAAESVPRRTFPPFGRIATDIIWRHFQACLRKSARMAPANSAAQNVSPSNERRLCVQAYTTFCMLLEPHVGPPSPNKTSTTLDAAWCGLPNRDSH